MLEIHQLRDNKAEILDRLARRANNALPQLVEKAIELDTKKRNLQVQLDGQLAEINSASKSIGALMKDGQASEAEALKARVAAIKETTGALKHEQSEAEELLIATLCQIPNAPNQKVKTGKSAEENEEVFAEGKIPVLHAGAVPHWDLAQHYKLIDFETGVKISGAGFPVYTGQGAKLQRALINFFLDEAGQAGYREVMTPHLVNEESGFGTGQLPDKEGQMYYVNEDKLYLIPTAEVPITNIYRDVILNESDLPVKHCGYTPCFRREAGSYGKDVRGLNRLHQFDKVEIVQIVHPDHSYRILEEMVEHVKGLLKKLDLPYRILRLCGGDMGFASAMTYDFEVYSTAQQRWLEVSSVSNFETYQSNRLKCRFRNAERKTQLAHTLNGSALALPRIVASLLENHQQPDYISIPKALQPYTKFDKISL
jgi:seryl-tRNA synthetase